MPRARAIRPVGVRRRRLAPAQAADRFDGLRVVGHLRAVKDPLRAAEASRLLPPRRAVRVVHARRRARRRRWPTRARAEERDEPALPLARRVPAARARCSVLAASRAPGAHRRSPRAAPTSSPRRWWRRAGGRDAHRGIGGPPRRGYPGYFESATPRGWRRSSRASRATPGSSPSCRARRRAAPAGRSGPRARVLARARARARPRGLIALARARAGSLGSRRRRICSRRRGRAQIELHPAAPRCRLATRRACWRCDGAAVDRLGGDGARCGRRHRRARRRDRRVTGESVAGSRALARGALGCW